MAFTSITEYAHAEDYLGGKQSRPLPGRRTRLERRSPTRIAVRYHDTDVVTYDADLTITLATGGYKTATTKVRWNEYQSRAYVWQTRGLWTVGLRQHFRGNADAVAHPVGDVVILGGDGTFRAPDAPEVKSLARERRAVQKYAANFIAALVAGKVPAPSAGDCWYCLARTESGETLGEAFRVTEHDRTHSDHLRAHMAESYFVPSLLVRATEVMPSSIAGREFMQACMHGRAPGGWSDGILSHQLQKALSRYILRQLGQTA